MRTFKGMSLIKVERGKKVEKKVDIVYNYDYILNIRGIEL